MSFDGPLVAFGHDVAAARDAIEGGRAQRRARYDAALFDAAVGWIASSDDNLGPILNRAPIDEVREIAAMILRTRLLELCAPLFETAGRIDRSLRVVSIMASPSGAGPERYAPRKGHVPQFRVRGSIDPEARAGIPGCFT